MLERPIWKLYETFLRKHDGGRDSGRRDWNTSGGVGFRMDEHKSGSWKELIRSIEVNNTEEGNPCG